MGQQLLRVVWLEVTYVHCCVFLIWLILVTLSSFYMIYSPLTATLHNQMFIHMLTETSYQQKKKLSTKLPAEPQWYYIWLKSYWHLHHWLGPNERVYIFGKWNLVWKVTHSARKSTLIVSRSLCRMTEVKTLYSRICCKVNWSLFHKLLIVLFPLLLSW